MKLLKDLLVLSNNHLNALESLTICFPLAAWQLGFASHLTHNPGHPACHHAKHRGSPRRQMHYGLGISTSSFKNVHRLGICNSTSWNVLKKKIQKNGVHRKDARSKMFIIVRYFFFFVYILPEFNAMQICASTHFNREKLETS